MLEDEGGRELPAARHLCREFGRDEACRARGRYAKLDDAVGC